MTSIQPELRVDRGAQAVAIYQAAFGAAVLHRIGEAVDPAAGRQHVRPPGARDEIDWGGRGHLPGAAGVEFTEQLDGLQQPLAARPVAQPQRSERVGHELTRGVVAVVELVKVRVALRQADLLGQLERLLQLLRGCPLPRRLTDCGVRDRLVEQRLEQFGQQQDRAVRALGDVELERDQRRARLRVLGPNALIEQVNDLVGQSHRGLGVTTAGWCPRRPSSPTRCTSPACAR